MIYVVLGMHKSGTTLVSQALHESGINMGEFDESLDYDNDNKYERHVTQEINRDLLHGFLIPPLDYLVRSRNRPLYDQAGYRRNKDSVALVRYQAFQNKFKNSVPPVIVETIHRLDAEYADWGFKDPRTCLTYPIWARALPEHRLIIVYRHYTQFIKRYRISQWNIPRLYRVLYGWSIHNQMINRYLNQTDQPTVVLSYERLMEGDAEYAKLRNFVGNHLVDTRDPNLYRNRSKKIDEHFSRSISLLAPFLPADPRKIYTELESWRARNVSYTPSS